VKGGSVRPITEGQCVPKMVSNQPPRTEGSGEILSVTGGSVRPVTE